MTGPVTILGQGAWGTSLGRSLADAGSDVRFWRRGESAAVLKGAGMVLSAVPAQVTREVLRSLAPALPVGVALVLTAKGLEKGTLKLQSEIAAEVAPGHPVAILTGPSFAPRPDRRAADSCDAGGGG